MKLCRWIHSIKKFIEQGYDCWSKNHDQRSEKKPHGVYRVFEINKLGRTHLFWTLTLFMMGLGERGCKDVLLPLFPLYFWILVLTFLAQWCEISSSYLVPIQNYWTQTKTTSQKKWFLRSNPYKIKVMTTSLIEMLDLRNFVHMTTSTIWFDSRDKTLLMSS